MVMRRGRGGERRDAKDAKETRREVASASLSPPQIQRKAIYMDGERIEGRR